MLWLHRRAIEQLEDATSVLSPRVQQLEEQQAALLACFEGARQFRIFTAHIGAAAETALAIGAAVEGFAERTRAPLPRPPRGHAGGRARARTAWRYSDGTFMSNAKLAKLQVEVQERMDSAAQSEYERYAAGGRGRAAQAQRAPNGTFLPT